MQNKYLSEEKLFEVLGDAMLEALLIGRSNRTPEEGARWLASEVERLTAQVWEGTPRLGGVYPSTN